MSDPKMSGSVSRRSCKFTAAVVLVVLAATVLAARAVGIDGTMWAVVAHRPPDPRINAQLDALASQEHATLTRFASVGQAQRQRPRLTLELVEQRSVRALAPSLARQTSRSNLPLDLVREGYILRLDYRHSAVPYRLRITASTAEGFHNALLRLPDLLRIPPQSLSAGLQPPAQEVRAKGNRVALVDYPSFPERGIVEGFYGTPWSYQDRLDILKFEGAHAMNAYYYAPKDDPYHRKLWRDPYPPEQMKQLAALVDTARHNFVDFCFAVSPGLSMTYSSDDDFSKLTAKVNSVQQLGVDCLALFLDDVPEELENPADKARFKDLGAAHVYLINRLYRYLNTHRAPGEPPICFTVTPTTYTNAWGSRDYIKELGRGVVPEVDLVWTGREVVSPTITANDARQWGQLLHRPPLIWDNFPVNDGIPWRLNLGPLVGRDPDLPAAARGLLSNPMNQAHASMIPLETVADYLWNSRAYDPSRSHQHAVLSQYGKDAHKLLEPFFAAYGDYWWQENIFKPLYVETRRPIDMPLIDRQVGAMDLASRALTAPEFGKLLPEISPIVAATRQRATQLMNDPAFRQLPNGLLLWRDDHDVLYAMRVGQPPTLDGDFTKWQASPLYVLNSAAQISEGGESWKGPQQFSARVALAWDDQNLYVGVDVTDPDLYQPFAGDDVDKGDCFRLIIDTAYRQDFLDPRAGPNDHSLLFSPGNFAGVAPSMRSEGGPLGPALKITAVWKKTPKGYSGDISIPAALFGRGLEVGTELGLALEAQKVLPNPAGAPTDDIQRITFSSKADSLFPVRFGNPATYEGGRLLAPPPAGP